MKAIPNPLIGKPWRFGPGKTHQPNDSVKMLRLDDGVWKPASGFISVPEGKK